MFRVSGFRVSLTESNLWQASGGCLQAPERDRDEADLGEWPEEVRVGAGGACSCWKGLGFRV